MTFADKVIKFNKSLEFTGKLPKGIRVMNPYRENKNVLEISRCFFKKYFDDNNMRHIVLGINPGRFGAGLTGIAFTDPKKLSLKCGIPFEGDMANEPSSTFIYEMIDAYGGVDKFYSRFFINAICPLGFTSPGKNGKEVNYNYYDSKELTQSAYPFILDSIKKQIKFGVYTDTAFCLGTGKNEKFLRELNEEHNFFGEIIALEHPRYIMQYKMKKKEEYIKKYIQLLSGTLK